MSGPTPRALSDLDAATLPLDVVNDIMLVRQGTADKKVAVQAVKTFNVLTDSGNGDVTGNIQIYGDTTNITTSWDNTNKRVNVNFIGTPGILDRSANYYLFEDFSFVDRGYFGTAFSGGVSCDNTWFGATSAAGAPVGTILSSFSNDANHMGIVALGTGGYNGSTGWSLLSLGSQVLVLGGGQITTEWLVKIPVLSNGSNNFGVYVGLSAGTTHATIGTNQLLFLYTHSVNSGNWVVVTPSGNTNTSVAATTNWTKFKIVTNAGNTNTDFYIDGVLVASVNTSALTGQTSPCIETFSGAGTVNTNTYVFADYCSVRKIFTSPR
jgi:hypothetical protein